MFEIDLEHQGNVITNDIEILRDMISAYYFGKDKVSALEDLNTADGKIAKGNYDPDGEKIGYISHFATCPAASKHRKKDDGEQVSR